MTLQWCSHDQSKTTTLKLCIAFLKTLHCISGYRFCDDGLQAIKYSDFCNGETYGGCRDGSDEETPSSHNCVSFVCPEGTWTCTNGQKCIAEAKVCDEIFHCEDDSDEAYDVCEIWKCPQGTIKLAGKFHKRKFFLLKISVQLGLLFNCHLCGHDIHKSHCLFCGRLGFDSQTGR